MPQLDETGNMWKRITLSLLWNSSINCLSRVLHLWHWQVFVSRALAMSCDTSQSLATGPPQWPDPLGWSTAQRHRNCCPSWPRSIPCYLDSMHQQNRTRDNCVCNNYDVCKWDTQRERETGKRKKNKNKKLKLSPKIIEKHKCEEKPKVTSMTSFSSSILVGFGRSSPGRNAGARGALRRASATEFLPGRRHGGARVSWATSDAANNSSSCANIVGSVESFHGMNWEVGWWDGCWHDGGWIRQFGGCPGSSVIPTS